MKYFFFLLFSMTAIANASVLLSGGQAFTYERDENQNYIERKSKVYSLGIGFDQLFYIFDYSYFNEQTGSGALTIERKVEQYMLWGQWTPEAWSYKISPYLTAGVGGTQQNIDTTLLGVVYSDRSRINGAMGAGFGARLNIPFVWLSTELRVLYIERWDPNLSLSLLGRIGIWF